MHPRLSFYIFLLGAATACADPSTAAPPASVSPADKNTITLDPITVTADLDTARSTILPSLGATSYEIGQQQIQNQSQGANAPFNQVLLRAPGVAQDSAANGDLHLRGEHANLQYRINDVLLPEGISGFGLELDPRFVSSLQLITGALPAQYGFRTAGIVDIQTKSGAVENGGGVDLYGGANNTFRQSFEYGGTEGKLGYFINGSHDHNDLGIENVTSSRNAIHDTTDQEKFFGSFSYLIDATSRVNVMLSGSYSDFQVPNSPGLPVGTAPGGDAWNTTFGPASFDSAALDENQNEQNYYAVATYQKSAEDLNYQVSVFGRKSGVHFTPDPTGDLYFNGVASDVRRTLYSGGIQGDASHDVGDFHTLRWGASFLDTHVTADSNTTVFNLDGSGNPVGAPFAIADNNSLHGFFTGVYLQDEWKIIPKVTVNYGARFDAFNSSFDNEHQLSPRINLIYEPTQSTTLHAGYARYFTPPPVENVSGATLAKFLGTSNDAGTLNDPVKAERADYFDAGITQKITKGFQVGLDGYYKSARNQLDDGLFGQTLILSAFNYAKGEVYGLELTASYTNGGFSAYANAAHSVARGEDWNSAQFLFDPTDAAYVKDHWIHLDHDQDLSGSGGVSYLWEEGTRLYADVIYGSGLREDSNVPNGGHVPPYCTLNLGAEQTFKLPKKQLLKIRLDVVNVADKSYELRSGSGVGVNAAEYGPRRGFYGGVSWLF